MLKNLTEVRKTAILLFVGLFACYLSLSSGSIAGQGYVGEEIDSGLRMLAVVNAWLKGLLMPQMEWSRHGPVAGPFHLGHKEAFEPCIHDRQHAQAGVYLLAN